MDIPRSPLLDWTYSHQEKSMYELMQSSLLTMEMEETMKPAEELESRDRQIAQLKELLERAVRERDEAQEKCQKVFFEKLLLQQQLQQQHLQSNPHSGNSSVEDDPRTGFDSSNGFSASDCDESTVSSPHHVPPPPPAEAEPEPPIVLNRPLPEKGKLLQAVMKAGPLLQTILLAGPLPQWSRPPPPLDTYQIPPPPVVIPSLPTLPTHPIHQDSFLRNINIGINHCGRMNRKRPLLSEGSDSANEFKCQRVALH